MPIYEYRCSQCGYQIQVLKGYDYFVDEGDKCPDCMEGYLHRVMSAFSTTYAPSKTWKIVNDDGFKP